jgi:hypothetical protein
MGLNPKEYRAVAHRITLRPTSRLAAARVLTGPVMRLSFQIA